MRPRASPTTTRTAQTTQIRTQTRTTPASEGALARAIAPVEADEFVAGYWEQKPLHVARGEAGRFDSIFSARDAERLITEPGLRYPGFRLVKEGAKLDLEEYTEDVPWRPAPFSGTARVPRVLAEFEAGATIVLQGLHLGFLPTARYCRALEAWLGHPVQANAYFTPRRSQGLAVHHDTHDVFVLQLSGSKRWLVYEPLLELPLRRHRHSARLGEHGDTVLDLTLEPGDTLYLPRGWLHEALTSDDDSLHLTVGINTYTWLDALQEALERWADEEVDLRRAVPPGGEGGAELVERLAERIAPELVATSMRERFVRTRRPILDGQLEELRALEELRPESLVERRATVVADFDGRALTFEGKSVVFPPHARAEVEALVAADGPLRLEELPGRLDAAGRLVLARRLVREGFLRIARETATQTE